MRFYKVEFYCEEQGHLGYDFCASKRDAQRTLRERGGSDLAAGERESIRAITSWPSRLPKRSGRRRLMPWTSPSARPTSLRPSGVS